MVSVFLRFSGGTGGMDDLLLGASEYIEEALRLEALVDLLHRLIGLSLRGWWPLDRLNQLAILCRILA